LEVAVTSVVQQRLALALEAARLGTWTWDIAAGTSEWDVRLEELHGLPPGGFGGTFEDWIASLHPEDRADCVAAVERALADPGPYVLLHRTIWDDGSVHHIECRGMVLVDDAGNPTGTTGVAADVTDRERQKAAVNEVLAQQSETVLVLQRALLPATPPTVPHTTVAARYIAAQKSPSVGGDWYAVLPLQGDRLGLAIGDVAGHGIDAVADMAAVRFSLRAIALHEPAPERVLDRLNEVVHVFESDTMVTALYGALDPNGGTWTYATAGHPPVVVRRPDGTTRWIDDPCDPPLGVHRGEYRRHAVDIEQGSTLVLYTDGLIERRTEPISTGLERLERACREGPADPEALCDFLAAHMLEGATVDDDVAIVAVRCGD
jgi:PAS domain S-box-containing protein